TSGHTPPELRHDPISGRWVVVAPSRARRPGAPRPGADEERDDVAGCPFCEGRERSTPPESFAIGPPGRAPDSPGWRVRVVPNKFPAFGPWPRDGDRAEGLFARRAAVGRQEVVVHSPRHVRTIADLGVRELALVAETWQARAATALDAGFPYVHALVNEGAGAGASLPHSHSQLVWLEDEPPLVAQERRAQEHERGCVVCRVLSEEREQRIRIVEERDGIVLLCPFAGRQPYEMLAAPLECEDDAFASSSLGAALTLAAEGVRRLREAEGDVPLNLWLHAGGHWHLEIMPRFGVLAGVELGSGYFVNTLAPESAAGVLREA
ncbi:MAG: galactose-1-phosphate uridylyltransferase, partial [Gaiellaceae bacterium]